MNKIHGMENKKKEKSVLEIRTFEGKLLFILDDPNLFNKTKPLKVILLSGKKEDIRYMKHTNKDNLVMQ